MIKFLLSCWLMLPIILSAEPIFQLYGAALQGGLMRGEISADVIDIFHNYQKVNFQDQQFILGFDRDEKLNHIITFVLADGTMISKRFSLQAQSYQIAEIELPPSKSEYSSPPHPELSKRIRSEAKMLKEARAEINSNKNSYISENFSRAVEGGRISGLFGSQRIINGVAKRPHNGLDIAAPSGTAVKAMNSGEVALTGDYFYNGKFVLLDHGEGLSSIYIHLSEITVEIGQIVKSGELIGKIGNSGRSTGPHLHWGISYRGKKIDPALISDLDQLFLRYPQEVDLSQE